MLFHFVSVVDTPVNDHETLHSVVDNGTELAEIHGVIIGNFIGHCLSFAMNNRDVNF